MELHAGNPDFFAATSGRSALIIFNSKQDREEAIVHVPRTFEGVVVRLECPEEADNRVLTSYDHLIELEAT